MNKHSVYCTDESRLGCRCWIYTFLTKGLFELLHLDLAISMFLIYLIYIFVGLEGKHGRNLVVSAVATGSE